MCTDRLTIPIHKSCSYTSLYVFLFNVYTDNPNVVFLKATGKIEAGFVFEVNCRKKIAVSC